MDDIAVAAGVAKGTLYYNFPSKTLLFVAVVSEGMDALLEILNREMVSDLHFPDHFKRLVRVNLNILLDHIGLLTIALNPTVFGFESATVAEIRKAWQRYLEVVADVLRTGQQQGYLRQGDPLLMAHAVLGTVGGIMRYYIAVRLDSPDEAHRLHSSGWLADELVRCLALGILSDTSAGGFRSTLVPTVEP